MRSLLLGLVVAVATLIPNLATADDQEIASHIMSRLQLEQQRGALKGFHVDMRVDQGTVWYKGFVSNQAQKDLILRTAQQAKNLGVVQIVDDISIQAPEAKPIQQPAQPTLAQTAFQEFAPQQVPAVQAAPALPPQQLTTPPAISAPAFQAGPVPAQTAIGGNAPLPLARSSAVITPAQGDAANLPGYAWPSYAAHPNYAGVSYPGQYSPAAWPYIGPFYPYPQVPLGWRKVTLEWDDGWWWLDFNNR